MTNPCRCGGDEHGGPARDLVVYGVWEFHDLVGLYATVERAERRREQVIARLKRREPDEDDWPTYVTVSPMLVHGARDVTHDDDTDDAS